MRGKNKEYLILKQALTEYSMKQWKKYEVFRDFNYKESKREKRKMNRMGREKIGLKNALHPEVDNVFERTRSNIIVWLNNRKNNGED
mgnify:CR=1 FL=1